MNVQCSEKQFNTVSVPKGWEEVWERELSVGQARAVEGQTFSASTYLTLCVLPLSCLYCAHDATQGNGCFARRFIVSSAGKTHEVTKVGFLLCSLLFIRFRFHYPSLRDQTSDVELMERHTWTRVLPPRSTYVSGLESGWRFAESNVQSVCPLNPKSHSALHRTRVAACCRGIWKVHSCREESVFP